MTSETENPIAGWYPDKRGGHRWWDGDAWTDLRRNAEGETFTEPGPESQLARRGATSPSKLGTIAGYLGAVVLLFSTFSPRWMTTSEGAAYNAFDRGLPWFLTGADYDPTFSTGSFAHGVIFVLLALVAFGLVLAASQQRMDGAATVVLGVGCVAFLMILANALAFRSAFSTLNEVGTNTFGTGIGIWLALLA